MEQSQIEQCLPLFRFEYVLRRLLHWTAESGKFTYNTLQPLNSQMIVIFVFLFHNWGLVHKLVSKFDLTFVVTFQTSFVKHLQCLLSIYLTQYPFAVNYSEIVVSLTKASLLGLDEIADDAFVVLEIASEVRFTLLFVQLIVQIEHS